MPSDILAQIEEAKNALPQNQTGLASDIEGVLGRARESAEALSVVKALMSDVANGENLAVAGLERLVAGFGEYDALVARVAANTGALVSENGQLDDTYRQLGQNAPAAFGDANTALERTLSLVGTVTAEVQKMQTALVDATIASALEWIDYEKELARVRNTMAAIGTAAGGIHTPAAPPQTTPPAPVPPPAAPSAPATPEASAATKAETAEKIEAAETEIADAMKAIVQKIGNFTLSDEQHAQAMADAQSLTGNFASQQSYLGFIRRAEGLANLKQTGTGDADLDAKVAKMTSDFEAALGRVANLQGSGADFEKIIARLSAAGSAGSDEDFESAMDKLGDVLHAEEEGAKTRRDLAAAIASLKEQTAGDANAELLKQILAQNPVGAMASNREAEARQNAARYSVVATDVNQTAAVRAEAADKAQLEKFIAETLSYYKKGTTTPEELREINQALDDFQNATDEDAKEAARQRIDQLTALRENAGHGNEISLGEGIAGKWKEKVADSRDEFNKFAGGNVQGAASWALPST